MAVANNRTEAGEPAKLTTGAEKLDAAFAKVYDDIWVLKWMVAVLFLLEVVVAYWVFFAEPISFGFTRSARQGRLGVHTRPTGRRLPTIAPLDCSPAQLSSHVALATRRAAD